MLGQGKRPVASEMGPAAPAATNGLAIDLRRAVADVWDARCDAIRVACAPHVPTGRVDEMDMLAWLTADALNHPLLHADDTNAVGKRVAAHAARVETKLKHMDAETRKAVGNARAAAGKKPELLPKVAAAAASGEKARAAYLEKSYDPQLPAPIHGTKRPEVCRRDEAARTAVAKAHKVHAHVVACVKELHRACDRTDRAVQLTTAAQDGPLPQLSQRIRQSQEAQAKEAAVRADANEALAALQEAIDQQNATVEAAEELHPEPVGEEWVFDEGLLFHMIFVELQTMTCAVAMSAAGHAHCAHCAHLMVRHAEDLTTDPPPGVAPPRRSPDNSEAFDRFLIEWRRSQVLDDTTISAQAWMTAEAASPLCPACNACCELCRAAGTLTAAGEAAAEEAAEAAAAADVIARSMWRHNRGKFPDFALHVSRQGWTANKQ